MQCDKSCSASESSLSPWNAETPRIHARACRVSFRRGASVAHPPRDNRSEQFAQYTVLCRAANQSRGPAGAKRPGIEYDRSHDAAAMDSGKRRRHSPLTRRECRRARWVTTCTSSSEVESFQTATGLNFHCKTPFSGHVAVLEVNKLQTGIRPLKRHGAGIPQDLQLRRPVKLIGTQHRVTGEPVQDIDPAAENILCLIIDIVTVAMRGELRTTFCIHAEAPAPSSCARPRARVCS